MLIFCSDNSCGDVVKDGDGSMKDKLKPCPFCGGTDTLCINRETDKWENKPWTYQYQVICDWNSGGCGSSSGFYDSMEDARDAWNERANCPECIKED